MNTQPTPSVLVVDDDPAQRSLFASFLEGQGVLVQSAANGEEALAAISRQTPALLISDVRMPGMTGLELLSKAREAVPGLPVLLVTAYADIRDAVDAMQSGAVNYLEKPIELDELLKQVQRFTAIPGPVASEVPALPEGIIAENEEMRRVLRDAALVAPSDSRVLITGESGVGKEVLADLIHAWSPRAGKPLVKVNCAAIPETLLESELFGHEKGSFTGASQLRIGRFEEADGGTMLLDEIAEMAPALQAKLLRVTQSGAFNRVGSNQERSADVRILAATHRDLEQEVAAGRFREDLYYRLNVIELHVPALRARQEDIVPLAQQFLQKFGPGQARFSPQALALLEAYAWPGNVRELRNAMERAALLARGPVILPEHLPSRVREQEDPTPAAPAAESSDGVKRMEDIEREAILTALREHGYNRTETAKALGISRRALTYKLRAYREQGHEVDRA